MTDQVPHGMLEEVGALLRAGRVEAARDLLAEAIERTGWTPDYLPAAAWLDLRPLPADLDDAEAVLAGIEPLLAAPPDAATARTLGEFTQGIAAQPEEPGWRLHCAAILVSNLGEPGWAEQVLRPIARDVDTPWHVARALSGILAVQDRAPEALAWAETAIAGAPAEAECQVHRAALLVRMARPAEALLAAGQALRLDPGNATAAALARAALHGIEASLAPPTPQPPEPEPPPAIATEPPPPAAPAPPPSRRIEPGSAPEALHRIGHAVRAGDLDEARGLLGALRTTDAEDFVLLPAALWLGEAPPAPAELPAEPPPEAMLAGAAALLAEPPLREVAERICDVCVRIAAEPAEPTWRIECASILVSILHEPAWAELLLCPLVQGAATSGPVARTLSGILHLLRRDEEALAMAEIAAEAMPQSADCQVHHAGLLHHLRRPAEALIAAGRALGLDPEHPVAWRISAAALNDLGYRREALRASRRAAADDEHAGFAEEIAFATATDAETVTAPSQRLALRRATAMPDWAVPGPASPAPPPPLGSALAARFRIIDAIMLREARTMFGHSRVGYAWALFEPLVHVFVLSVMMLIFAHGTLPLIGTSMPVFYMTGILPYLFFCHLSEQAFELPRNARAVLQVPAISILDIFTARILLRAATDVIVMLISISVFVVAGESELPHDPLGICAVYAVLLVMGAASALTNMVLSQLSSAWERSWSIVLRGLYFFSGIFYHPSMMPPEVRDLVLWVPLVHAIELFREAYFPRYTSPHLDLGYLLEFTACFVLLALLLVTGNYRRLRVTG